MDDNWAWYISEDSGFLEGSGPPFQILRSAMRWGAWNERTVMEYAEHGLQSGEKSPTFSDDKARVKQLSI